ncbi:MAG: P-II family nitrogen regulator [Clostridia bacterium]|jgi:nitrogen regulatory protein PII|nr:P-II family nitrogen regulator [Clostridia bacterium]MBQ5833403.1 P-II family nitrogen regulator [Clostridia bacterium]
MKKGYKCILAVVNNGFAEEAMEAAKACGAKGGTILHGRGTISKEAESAFNITIQPDKEIVMILAKEDRIDGILKGLYNAVGTATKAQGIVFAIPVDESVGLEASPSHK